MEDLSFSAHARLKDIVGRGLIISDHIAIIELIKNSKDAGANGVSINFRKAHGSFETELVIRDEGSGMSMDDIKYKWLNIAYSEKKNSTPAKGAYAGNKGIGRFSCDRLGAKLHVYTRKLGHKAIKVVIDWNKFEVDDKDIEIGDITTEVYELEDCDYENETGYPISEHGTILIIKELRESWDIDKLRSLRKELEKFIIDPEHSFFVNMNHWVYSKDDPINAPIENKIFEELDFRTTSIKAKTIDGGDNISIEMRHDGDFVFRSIERNPYSEIRNLEMKIMFLNQPAKAFFNKRTGYRSIDFGSIFLFLNGFRVSPYGAPDDDWLGIQKRHAQGVKRFMGTRDLVGFINIYDTENRFIPVSSREGLVKNLAFRQITSDDRNLDSCIDSEKVYGIFHKLIRKLERFVVDGLDWDSIDRNAEEITEEILLSGNYKFLKGDKPVLESIDSIISIRTPANHITDIDINIKYLSELAQQENKEYELLVDDLESKFGGTPLEMLKPSEKRDLSKFISRQAKEIANKNETNKRLEEQTKTIKKELEVEQRKRIFSDFEKTVDQTRIIQLHHQIGVISDRLLKKYNRIIGKYRSNPDSVTKEELFSLLEYSVFHVGKIESAAKLASKAGFDLAVNNVNIDLIQFISEYLDNFKDISVGWGLKVTFRNPDSVTLIKSFKPVEITMVIDNIIDNAGKADARNIIISVEKNDSEISILFDNDGKGLTERFTPEQLFENGITTTKGSGIGLGHVKSLIKDMNGQVEITDTGKGVKVRIFFNENKL